MCSVSPARPHIQEFSNYSKRVHKGTKRSNTWDRTGHTIFSPSQRPFTLQGNDKSWERKWYTQEDLWSLCFGPRLWLVRKLSRIIWWLEDLTLNILCHHLSFMILIIYALMVINSFWFKVILVALKDMLNHWHSDGITRCSVSKTPKDMRDTTMGFRGRSAITSDS